MILPLPLKGIIKKRSIYTLRMMKNNFCTNILHSLLSMASKSVDLFSQLSTCLTLCDTFRQCSKKLYNPIYFLLYIYVISFQADISCMAKKSHKTLKFNVAKVNAFLLKYSCFSLHHLTIFRICFSQVFYFVT